MLWRYSRKKKKNIVQKDMGPFNTLIYHTGAPVDGAHFKDNYITVGQLITSLQSFMSWNSSTDGEYSWKRWDVSQPCCRLSYRARGIIASRIKGVPHSYVDTCLEYGRLGSWRNRRLRYEEKVDALRLTDPKAWAKLFTIQAPCHICLTFRIGVICCSVAECQLERHCVLSIRAMSKNAGKSCEKYEK